MRKIATFPFTELPQIPLLVRDFIEGNLSDFEEESFSLKNIETKIQRKKNSFSKENRALLVAVLQEQMSGNCTEKQKLNLQRLANDNAFTITTGHQLNLFSGAIFFVYKILQTIKTAEYLNQNNPDNQFIPVFWMATEDHDFEEIRSFQTKENRYTIDAQSGTSVGRITPNHFDCIRDFEREMAYAPFGKELVNIFKESYLANQNLAESTRRLVQRLFGEYGILIIDGDDARLKSSMKTVFSRELKEELLFKNTDSQRKKIEERYGKVQVNPREINLFYLRERRERIVRSGEQFSTLDRQFSFTEEEILQELNDFPERFSPNAVLRPVYQETILPNIAYIGGNAEIAYWLELKDFFKVIHLPFPVLIPRHSMLWLSEKQTQKIEKYGLSFLDILGSLESIVKNKITVNEHLSAILASREQMLIEAFQEIEREATQTDITFSNLVKAEKQRMHKSFQKMAKRLWRAEKKKNEEKIERLSHLYTSIHPHYHWQERQWNFSVFYAEEGRLWLETCYEIISPDDMPSLVIAEI